MEIVIEIKPNYTTLVLHTIKLVKEEVAALVEKIDEQRNEDCHSFIVNMQNCEDIDNSAFQPLMDLHNDVYSRNGSLAFCEINEVVLQKLKKEQLHLSLNITPTLIEAVDIVNMESLERELLG